MRTELYKSARADDNKPVVLVVDDEETVLETLSLQLGREYRVLTAPDGDKALAVLAEHGTAAAVISDMRMPGMNGIELLRRVQMEYPAITRVLHTGYGDMATAVAAINSGGVYRYLPKPADTESLRGAIRESVAKHDHEMADRELLDRTLRTGVKALFGVLELSNPAAYQRAGRIRTLVGELCHLLQLDGLWEIEVAAMASQLGAVTVPPSTWQKLERGLPLSADEQATVDAMPRIAVRLLGDIPMLEEVLAIVDGLTGGPGPAGGRSALAEDAIAVLRTAIAYESLELRGIDPVTAITALEERHDHYPHVIAALRRLKGVRALKDTVRSVRVTELEVGMRLIEDVVATNGLVLIGKETVITELMLDRLTNFARAVELVEEVLAAVPYKASYKPTAYANHR
ncbi:response regulator receiver modulated metal-depenent phosphohydrolase [Actinoplanes cyaneus]|uniref:Response regulator receiver modulated metal-depenent phosphohydrolase n=1 Tax=Actinoplanes cyaneus TaxID=52696 RepID=A0A919IVP9_9ACTN|nr:response regulator [Actinoplanes cyaneus]MCW2143767.1 response regulator receiver protein [Actinoplanes cyaneus]GID70603.1 response regulator receiver modulated metal-depenent phosphohydrolase [Actinoplanes cyaneus]